MEDIQIEPSELQVALHSTQDVQLVDVREGWEFALAHLDGAILMPVHELDRRLHEIDRERPAVVYCHHGVRSLQAALALRARGYDRVRSLRGGLERWSRTIDPTVPRY